jgi:cell volume regulation protein A
LLTTYLITPILLLAVVLAAAWLERWSVPVILIALGAGITFGSDVLRIWHFDDVKLANEAANLALVFILFHGGFVTKRSDLRAVALPAVGLATWGVLLTAAASFVCLRWILGWSLEMAVLLAVIVSSTDAAAIFSILRRQVLPSRLASTIEIESAANDPMAILLTTVAVAAFASGKAGGGAMLLSFFWQFSAGPLIGFVLARAALWLFNRLTPGDRGYYYVLFLAVVLLTYGVAGVARASGMLAVFTAGFVMGNHPFVHKRGVHTFSLALSSIANIGLFVMLGLLVFPSRFSGVWVEGTLLFLVITFVARPAAVFLGTLGMHFDRKDRVFASWAGMRGAVPIVLSTYPAAAGLPIGDDVFNLVFFAVILSILVQGSTLGLMAKWLKLAAPARPKPLFHLELITMAQTDYDLMSVELPDPRGAEGPRIRDLKLPEGAVIAMITRGKQVIIPKGNLRLQGWDHVTLLVHAPDAEKVRKALLDPFEQASRE